MEDPIAKEIQAQRNYSELTLLVKNDIRSALRKGQILKALRDTEDYKLIGEGGYDTFNSFLNDPALKISRSYAFQHIQMFDFFVVDLSFNIDELVDVASVRLLRDCMYYITKENLSNDQAVEVIEKAKTLSYRDFFLEVKGEELPPTPQLAEPEPRRPDAPIDVTPEQQREMEQYQRPDVRRCVDCSKIRVEYDVNTICQCNGIFHVLDKSGVSIGATPRGEGE